MFWFKPDRMSRPPRPFLLRLTLVGIGMILFIVAVFLGLGWMLFKTDWPLRVLGADRTAQLLERATLVRAELQTKDTDGDGVSDWLEEWYDRDPKNADDHPQLFPSTADGRGDWVYCGQRVRMRWGMHLENRVMRWLPGFRTDIYASEPILLMPGAQGLPTKGPLKLATSRDGYLEFDVLVTDFGNAGKILFAKPSTLDYIGDPGMGWANVHAVGWPLPPLPATIEMGPPEVVPFQEAAASTSGLLALPPASAPSNDSIPYLVWQPLPPAVDYAYMIEAARVDRPMDWMPLDFNPSGPPGRTPLKNYHRIPGYSGPLKYRVVPVIGNPP